METFLDARDLIGFSKMHAALGEAERISPEVRFLTVRFLLKAAVLFLIAGSLVLYLAFTLRSETKTETEQ